ncbi:preprotein translocase subunit SecE [Aeromicrobium phragmitis]|uniref:Protein translocase subunit SecE n=1 Tax=Aeromicrobium phragmitis TaxID=2478914 RepID=A0A3L8PM62_9ACTN|nr:preprotein translocase subunit SecE [Aeromicrobium phragmitis]
MVSDRHELVGARGKRTSPLTFYRQVVAELRKVVWPTRPQVVNYFFVVLTFVLIMMAIISGLDYGFGQLMFWIFG